MMKAYLDITLLPGADIGHSFLWEKVYQRIHLGLVDMQTPEGLSTIGIALPEYNAEKYQLGTKIRLLAPDHPTLERFNALKLLNRLSDYVHVTGTRDIPSNIKGYTRYKRQQSKSSLQRLARRKSKYENIEVEKALQLLSSRKEVLVKAPFVKVSSVSTRQSFRIFIVKESASELINENFSCYGLRRGLYFT